MRKAEITRTTSETDVFVSLDLDGSGVVQVDTGVPFFDHMLNAFGRHGLFDLTVKATGDTEIDDHHTVEDVGIVLGQALKEALGDKVGITRFGHCALPMDETLVLSAVDISNRGSLHWKVDAGQAFVGTFDTSLAKEFFIAFATNAGITLHAQLLAGENAHHILEATFKSVARTLRQAVALDPRVSGVPSTKGSL